MDPLHQNRSQNSSKSEDIMDLDRIPEMEEVQRSSHALEFDGNAPCELALSESALGVNPEKETDYTAKLGSPLSPSNQDGSKGSARQFRISRGVSMLPVRLSAFPVRHSDQLKSTTSPPQVTSPASKTTVRNTLSPKSPTGSGQLPTGNLSTGSPSENLTYKLSSGQLPNNLQSSLNGSPMHLDSNDLLNTYIQQLASKEAKVGSLRNTIARLQVDLRIAEADLAEFKNNGNKLAQIVHEHGDKTVMKSSGKLQSGNGGQSDVIGLGRRVVDEINTQFWSFLEDVKSATMGNSDFDMEQSRQTRLPETRPRSPSPTQRLNPKKSIQNFIKSRSNSPIREALMSNRSTSPFKQERKEMHASQRLRESERLSRKLSHIDLRAPSKISKSIQSSS